MSMCHNATWMRKEYYDMSMYGVLGELATYDFVKHELMIHRSMLQSSGDEGMALHVVASLITGIVAATGKNTYCIPVSYTHLTLPTIYSV